MTRDVARTVPARLAVAVRCAAAGLALAGAAVVTSTTPAAAAPVSAAAPALRAAGGTGCAGVLVVVEFRDVPQGGGTRTGCAPNPSSGIAALRQAGFGVTLGTGPYSGGFICALDGAPARGCGIVDNDTYWSYWWMAPGTSRWVYSQTGAAGRHPQHGGIEAWVWQSVGGVNAPAPRSAVAPAPPTPRPSPSTRPSGRHSTTPQQTAQQGTSGSTSGSSGGSSGGSSASTAGATGGTSSGTSTMAGGSAQPAGPAPSAADSGGTTGRALAARAMSGSAGRDGGQGWPRWTGVLGAAVAVVLGADTVRRVLRPSRPVAGGSP